MKKKSVIATMAMALFLCLGIISHVYADSTSYSPSGTATQPDLDMQGSDILNADDVNANNVNTTTLSSNQVTTDGLTATNGSITNLTSNQVTANTATIGNGTVTGTLQAGRILLSRTPTAGNDVTNMAYVNSLFTTLQNQIHTLNGLVSNLQNQVNNLNSRVNGLQSQINSLQSQINSIPPPAPTCQPGYWFNGSTCEHDASRLP